MFGIIDDNGNEISLEHHLISLAIRKNWNRHQAKKAKAIMSEGGKTALDLALNGHLYEKDGAIFMKNTAESEGGTDAVLYKSPNFKGFNKPQKGEKRYQK
jgi:hypothetical protein